MSEAFINGFTPSLLWRIHLRNGVKLSNYSQYVPVTGV